LRCVNSLNQPTDLEPPNLRKFIVTLRGRNLLGTRPGARGVRLSSESSYYNIKIVSIMQCNYFRSLLSSSENNGPESLTSILLQATCFYNILTCYKSSIFSVNNFLRQSSCELFNFCWIFYSKIFAFCFMYKRLHLPRSAQSQVFADSFYTYGRNRLWRSFLRHLVCASSWSYVRYHKTCSRARCLKRIFPELTSKWTCFYELFWVSRLRSSYIRMLTDLRHFDSKEKYLIVLYIFT